MTGIGLARGENASFAIEIEIRSVNHRFLAFQFRTPGDFSAFDSELEGIARKSLQRGSLSINITIRRAGPATAHSVVDFEQARAVASALKRLAKELKLSGKISIETIAAAPGIFLSSRSAVAPDDDAKELLFKTYKKALDSLLESRAREGSALAADLLKRINLLRSSTRDIEARAPKSVVEYHARLKQRAQELIGEGRTSLKDSDLARELAILAEKYDVAEEVARLRAHVEELDALLQKTDPVGRRIDFLLQEMGREVNTIGSKSVDLEITRIVMDLKAELERIREQSANLE